MYLARVIGTVVASQKAANMVGLKLLVVEPIDKEHQPAGEPHVAVDAAQAGEGDIVSCVGSREAALAVEPSFVPVDAAIIGIVDRADWEPSSTGAKGKGAR